MSDQKPLALVTGASRGIGAAIAERLANDGYQVIGTATSDSGATAIRERLATIDAANNAVVLNIADAEQTAATIKHVLADYGTPAVVVNNAGITRDNLFLRMSDDEWDAVVNTNLGGVFRVCKALAKPMIKQKAGSIINISSIIGTTGNAGQANYAAAKAGLEGFSRSLAQEIASRNIRVNCIAPGFIQTDMTDVLPEAQKEAILASIPSKALGQVEDIAGAVAFLAGEDSKYITGQTIHVNGGMNMG
ncbi:3-oxoacyl-ACP reductase FabG [Bacterioplanoides sp. SCSIO 12839]|uniref:3-oxoacyl-ACP reductase FabG n=1 Tax=Bacterioplanoides sp. SCSIO 12839 TaxID=2829569 RepID=UPI0021070ED7|nr:3-oxoacyl-ACP reductase FabG [Bacterioplanoides sp. SCSIO 12839]UTW49902.1 3-oxoacyl-ACP reductase FabG [Bacterioplanoides sp. SCSIO 12839]